MRLGSLGDAHQSRDPSQWDDPDEGHSGMAPTALATPCGRPYIRA